MTKIIKTVNSNNSIAIVRKLEEEIRAAHMLLWGLLKSNGGTLSSSQGLMFDSTGEYIIEQWQESKSHIIKLRAL